jgi:hypothetical protein
MTSLRCTIEDERSGLYRNSLSFGQLPVQPQSSSEPMTRAFIGWQAIHLLNYDLGKHVAARQRMAKQALKKSHLLLKHADTNTTDYSEHDIIAIRCFSKSRN